MEYEYLTSNVVFSMVVLPTRKKTVNDKGERGVVINMVTGNYDCK